jgi:23S rRNA (adenine2503-C2)-methyltransferase
MATRFSFENSFNEKEMGKKPLGGMTLEELQSVAAEAGMARYAAAQIARRLYRCHAQTIAEMVELPAKKRAWLDEHYQIGNHAPTAVYRSSDGTAKYLFAAALHFKKRRIETVYIPSEDRGTVCLSSQLGCRMGCRFCMTGRGGFTGNLSAGEMLNQLQAIPEFAGNQGNQVTNAVFMGMGEPMDNIDEVLKALTILTSEWGYGWSPRRITVSTVGVPEAGLRRFLAESRCRLAVSLHSPFSAERATWIPAERIFPAKELIAMLRKYDFGYQRRISFEYILFRGKNDSEQHISELVRILRGLTCRVNLIRYHSVADEGFESPSTAEMEAFCERLNAYGLSATVRASRGEDVEAACGLLGGERREKKGLPRDIDISGQP